MKRLASLLTGLLLCTATTQAETLVNVGIVGNSGEQGDTLIHFAEKEARGMGTVYDRFGSLWDRAGKGVLNRYAVDGRLLGQYRIPENENGNDQLTLVGDLLVLLIDGRLYTLPVTAATGSEAKALDVQASALSFAADQGRLAILQPDEKRSNNRLLLLDPAHGTTSNVATLSGSANWVEIGADGSVYAVIDWMVHCYRDGSEITTGWPRRCPGERPQIIDGRWYGHAWHSTIRRYNSDLDPAPGVTFGGASGSFIGHLDQNSELINSRGLARLREDLYAASGFMGTLQLLAWHGDRQQFEAVRRISAIPRCPGLGLDRDGNIYYWNGVWDWTAGPDTPLRSGVNGASSMGQAVMLDNDVMIQPGYLWDRPTFYRGKLSGEVSCQRIDAGCALTRTTVGTAAYQGEKEFTLLTIDPDGSTKGFAVSPSDGKYLRDLGEVTLNTATPVTAWTSLAMQGSDTLLAAGDGAVIVFAREGNGWKETRRWSSWGSAATEHFGAHITIANDAKSLVVADTDRQRVLCFDLTSFALRSQFGNMDAAGSSLSALNAPTTIAVRDRRVVVYDSGNQRLVKLVREE